MEVASNEGVPLRQPWAINLSDSAIGILEAVNRRQRVGNSPAIDLQGRRAVLSGIWRAQCRKGRDHRSTRRARLRCQKGGNAQAPRCPVGHAAAEVLTLPHAGARVARVAVRDVSAHRTDAVIVGELIGFDDKSRIVRLSYAGDVVRRVRIGAE